MATSRESRRKSSRARAPSTSITPSTRKSSKAGSGKTSRVSWERSRSPSASSRPVPGSSTGTTFASRRASRAWGRRSRRSRRRSRGGTGFVEPDPESPAGPVESAGRDDTLVLRLSAGREASTSRWPRTTFAAAPPTSRSASPRRPCASGGCWPMPERGERMSSPHARPIPLLLDRPRRRRRRGQNHRDRRGRREDLPPSRQRQLVADRDLRPRAGDPDRSSHVLLSGHEDVLEEAAHRRAGRRAPGARCSFGDVDLEAVEVARRHVHDDAALCPQLDVAVGVGEVRGGRPVVRHAKGELHATGRSVLRNDLHAEDGLPGLAREERPESLEADEVPVPGNAVQDEHPPLKFGAAQRLASERNWERSTPSST